MVSFRAMLAAACVAAAAWPALAQPQASGSDQPEAAIAPAGEQAADPLAPAPMTEEEFAEAAKTFEAGLQHRTGVITLAKAHVTLKIPEGFYFLDTADTRKVLEEAWGNPPDADVDGMIFPDNMAATREGSWGVVITYENSGYVSDADAASIDYDMLIDTMREHSETENIQRKAQGYPALEIIGWATKPRYDGATHKLYWAKELTFDSDPVHTLNYDMRVLGRYGVLSLNFIAGLDQLADIEKAGPAVLAMPEFDLGARYADFNASTDASAGYGIAGLIGGGAAAAVLAKNGGILAALFGVIAKFGIYVLAALGAAGAWVVSLFTGKKPAKKAKGGEVTEQRNATSFFDGPPEAPPAEETPPPASSEGGPPSPLV
jgi:uncharacterized membrane-anchored protein